MIKVNEGLKPLAERYFSGRMKDILLADSDSPDETYEYRLFSGKEVAVVKKSGVYFISETGECVSHGRGAHFSPSELRDILKSLSDNSLYSVREKLKNGYLPLEGGHRAGVTGRCVTENGHISYITDISSLTIRIAHSVRGAATKILPHIADGGIKNTLIVSPPGCGKTTMLRDIARFLGNEPYLKRVCIADERGEIAAMRGGVCYNDVGLLTSVMDACPKYEGMMSLLRSSSPEVMITDEIGSEKDAEAVVEVVKSGASVICSTHGADIKSAICRPGIKSLSDIFELYILLSGRNGPGTVEEILHA